MTAPPLRLRLPLTAVAVAALCGAPACRGVDELVASVNARVFVVGVDDASVVRIAVDDQRVEGRASADANVATFALALAPGPHAGTVVVLGGLASDRDDPSGSATDDDSGDDDSGDDVDDDDEDDWPWSQAQPQSTGASPRIGRTGALSVPPPPDHRRSAPPRCPDEGAPTLSRTG